MPTKKSPSRDPVRTELKRPKRSPRRSRQKGVSLIQSVSFSRPIVKPKTDSSVSEPVSILKSPEATPMSSPKISSNAGVPWTDRPSGRCEANKMPKKSRGPRIVLNPEEKVIVQACKKIHPKRKYNQSQWLEYWKETRVPFFSRFRDILPQGIRLAVLNPDRRYLVDLNALRTIDASDEERVRYYAHLVEEAIWNIK